MSSRARSRWLSLGHVRRSTPQCTLTTTTSLPDAAARTAANTREIAPLASATPARVELAAKPPGTTAVAETKATRIPLSNDMTRGA